MPGLGRTDDRTFVGRPYLPFPNFTGLVKGTGTGFGVIHWTTRPLDIYFKSLAEQALFVTKSGIEARTINPHSRG